MHHSLFRFGLVLGSESRNSSLWEFQLPGPHLNCTYLEKVWAESLHGLRQAKLLLTCLLKWSWPDVCWEWAKRGRKKQSCRERTLSSTELRGIDINSAMDLKQLSRPSHKETEALHQPSIRWIGSQPNQLGWSTVWIVSKPPLPFHPETPFFQ